MSSSSEKKLYSNGGANPQKSVDKSKKGSIIEHKEDIIADFKSSNFNGKINIPPRSIDVDKLNFDNNHINERKHMVNEKQAKQFIKDAKMSYTKYVNNIEFENYIGDNGIAYVDINNNLIRTAFPKSEYTKGTQRILNTLSKYESGD